MRTVELDALNRKYKSVSYGKIPEVSNKNVVHLAAPHIDSFNFFVEEGLKSAVESLPPVQFPLPNGEKISVTIQNVSIGKPELSGAFANSVDVKIYPKECIEKGSTYKAPIRGTVVWSINESVASQVECIMGEIPIMVKSKKCNLYGMNPAELVRHGELVNETGGYFIVNGGCRVLRLLIANRRNYPMAIIRKNWKKRDINFSEKGVLMRCVSNDETTSMNIVHHLTTGGAKLGLQIRKEIFLIPLMMALKVLLNFSDKLIYLHLIRGRENDHYYSEKVKMMLRELQDKKLFNQEMCKEYIGKTFRAKLSYVIPIWKSDEEVCDYLFQNHVLIHLNDPKSKFETLCMMTRKLFAFIGGEIIPESADDLCMQEASLGGYTYLQLLKAKLLECLIGVRTYVRIKSNERGDTGERSPTLEADMRTGIQRCMKLEHAIQSFIATGSLPKNISCGLMQNTGLTVTFEHLNRMRDMSHLRAIHRGSYFVEMKSIGPRRLSGESWGFICPVHTPDGAPCGLLNHLAYHCVIPCQSEGNNKVHRRLFDLGMTSTAVEPLAMHGDCLEVLLDGKLAGYVTKDMASDFTAKLRALKVKEEINKHTEIVLIEDTESKTQYPALYIMTSAARLMRPVINLKYGAKVEFVGTLEQNYMNIAISPEDIKPGIHTHMEIEKTSMLSNIGKMVPFSDCNPNPRNMYQCQMGKQTMGTPLHNWRSQTFSKLYRLQYPQIPLVRNSHYDLINMEEFCMGFNAVLAIVSYTGFDMEDAMVINKCAMERGLAHGQVYKSEFVDLGQLQRRRGSTGTISHTFKRDPSNAELVNFLDFSGLPYPGTKLTDGDPYYCVLDINQNKYNVVKYKGEDCVVDKYTIISNDSVKQVTLQKVNITIRIRRDPIIGDKFASRSGQKGVMSRLYPMEDLPFSERGIVPDIIFNPHGIPSRMTAGTLIDLIAGKCASEFGKAFDSTPFGFDDENPAYDYYGKILEKAGFNYYGEDVLYCGTDGRMMQVDVFEGVVYYQRLRHMTADKWQVRSSGPMDTTTHQPIKGRKRGGAIRFGEMERDCLISHGAAYTLRDRLLHCSDESEEWVCTKCGNILSALSIGGSSKFSRLPECSFCGTGAELRLISMPYAFKHLVSELASMGIYTSLGMKTAETITRTQNYPIISAVCDDSKDS